MASGSTYAAGETGGAASVNHTHQHGMRLGGFYSSTVFENNSGVDGAISWDSNNNKSIPAYTRVDTASMSINSACSTTLAT